MHESSSYWRVYRLSSVFNVYEMWTSHLFEFENQALCDEITYWWGTWFSMHAWMWINSLIGWEQVREQVSTSVQQRDELDSRMICNVIHWSLILMAVIFYHLFLCHMQYAVCNIYTCVWYHGRSRLCLLTETTMIPRW